MKTEYTMKLDDIVEGTYVVKATINDQTFYVNCQFDMTNDYKESAWLTCSNESGGDIKDSGLLGYLESIGIEEYSDEYDEIVNAIVDCAEAHLPENSVLRIIKEADESYELETELFGAFGPTDVQHCKYVNSAGEIIVTSEDTSEPRAENQLLGLKQFADAEEFESWRDAIYADGHYGDCSVSYRAWQDIVGQD